MEKPFYNTQNSILATALKLFGCQHPKNDREQVIPCSNTFTKENLRGFVDGNGQPLYAGKGMTPEQCAVDAHKRGLTGILIYHFEQSDDQKEFCKGWEKMQEEIANQEEERKRRGISEAQEMPIGTLNISHEDLGRLFCLFEKKRKELFKLVRMVRPALALMEMNVESTGDHKSRISGHGTIRSLPL
jgi:hypothetical protein